MEKKYIKHTLKTLTEVPFFDENIYVFVYMCAVCECLCVYTFYVYVLLNKCVHILGLGFLGISS